MTYCQRAMEEETMHKSTRKIQHSCKPRMSAMADAILENVHVHSISTVI